MTSREPVSVGGRRLELSNLEKVLYPSVGFTKADVIDYYSRIAPALLPHLKGRALTLKRYPNGVASGYFYEKRCPPGRPPWIRTEAVYSERRRGPIDYCLADDLPSLVWVANLADLELHTSLSKAGHPDRPTMVVFDLDPGPPADVMACAQVALRLRELLDGLGLRSFPKTSGSKGLQVYVPLNEPHVGYEATKSFAHAVALILEREQPRAVVAKMARSLRSGRVFVDWSQNDRHKTTVCVYSLRAMERPTVSTPVTWEEVESAVTRGSPKSLAFEAAQVQARVKRQGDLFAPVEALRQKLPRLHQASGVD